MTYDNLFLNNTVKDIAMLSTRSVGWNLGSFKEVLLGGLKDPGVVVWNYFKRSAYLLERDDLAEEASTYEDGKIPKELQMRIQRNKEAWVAPVNPSRMTYILGLVTVNALVAAVYQKIKTDEWPKEMLDYVFPRNGEKNEKGEDQRSSLPTYMKDVYHWYNDPLKTMEGKTSPLFNWASEVGRNANYQNTEIYSGNIWEPESLKDIVLFSLEQAEPISSRNARRERAVGASRATQIEQFFGINQAPAGLNLTGAEKLAHELAHTISEPRTREAAARRDMRLAVTRALRAKKPIPKEILDARKRGEMSRKDWDTAHRNARSTPLEQAFSSLGIRDAVRVYNAATPEEKKLLGPRLRLKRSNAMKVQSPSERKKTNEAVNAALSGK
jgi:hypothetical protein